MRLRYLWIDNAPPLNKLAIPFQREEVLGRACSINFVVGINGSGKSRLLRALAEVFVRLETGDLPTFPVRLAYDLTGSKDRSRTIYVDYNGGGQSGIFLAELSTALVEKFSSPQDWDSLHKLSDLHKKPEAERKAQGVEAFFSGASATHPMPGGGTIVAYLPKTVLGYTSGAYAEWERIFQPEESPDDSDELSGSETEAEERPAGWTIQQERQAQATLKNETAIELDQTELESNLRSNIGLFVPPDGLNLALCAVTLEQATLELEKMADQAGKEKFIATLEKTIAEKRHSSGWRGILNEVGWLYPVSIGFRINFRPENFNKQQTEIVKNLYELATDVVCDAEPGVGRWLFYDLQELKPDKDAQDSSTGALLRDYLAGDDQKTAGKAFNIFRQLRELQRVGILENVTISLRKLGVPDLIFYHDLSDGERAFLGRMALFYLLDAEDVLILLDEPEIHFNDAWKREIVNIIDDSLRDRASAVISTTHSSIALTDVFNTEITLLSKDRLSGEIERQEVTSPTFGTAVEEVMRLLFGAEDSIGIRATEFLDLMLFLAEHPTQVQAIWQMDKNEETIKESQEFRDLLKEYWRKVEAGRETERARRALLAQLLSIQKYTEHDSKKDTIEIADALAALAKRLGPGFYQFEFRRRLRAIRQA